PLAATARTAGLGEGAALEVAAAELALAAAGRAAGDERFAIRCRAVVAWRRVGGGVEGIGSSAATVAGHEDGQGDDPGERDEGSTAHAARMPRAAPCIRVHSRPDARSAAQFLELFRPYGLRIAKCARTRGGGPRPAGRRKRRSVRR